MRIKLALGHSALEDVALGQRLFDLGIKVGPDRTIDPSSLSGVEGGLEAVQRLVGKDGALDLAAAAELKRARRAIGEAANEARTNLGPEAPTTDPFWAEIATNLLRTGVEGLVAHLRRVAQAESPSKFEIDLIASHARGFHRRLSQVLPKLGLEEPDVVRSLAGALADLSAASQGLVVALSERRVKWLDDGGKRKEILASLRASVEVLGPVQQGARALAEPVWKAFGSAQIAREIDAWIEEHPAPTMANMAEPGMHRQPYGQELARARHDAIVRVIDQLERETGLPRETIAAGLTAFVRGPGPAIEHAKLVQTLRYLESTMAPSNGEKPVRFIEAQLLAGVLPLAGGTGLIGGAFVPPSVRSP